MTVQLYLGASEEANLLFEAIGEPVEIVVWKTVTEDLPPLIPTLRRLLEELSAEENQP